MQGVLDLIWEKLLPKMRTTPMLPTTAGKPLAEKLASLKVRPAA